ncbi:MAG: hypothetical protein R3C44_21060 [Chloroflexota bacterium]
MNAILIYEARNVGLLPMQWFWLVLITTLVAGVCIWIIGWGDKDDAAIDDSAAATTSLADEKKADA